MPDNQSNTSVRAAKRKVLLVDDHPVVLEALTKLLNKHGDLAVCHAAQDSAAALEAIGRCQPDVVVLDLSLGDGHGLNLIKEIRSRQNRVPIIVYSISDESSHALRVLQAGAQGFVNKQEPSERLLSAINTVLEGGCAVSPNVFTQFMQTVLQPSSKPSSSPVHTLGDREREVFELLGKGVGTREIAAQLGCSIKTIETYRARIKEKLHLTSATALIHEAVRWVESRH